MQPLQGNSDMADEHRSEMRGSSERPALWGSPRCSPPRLRFIRDMVVPLLRRGADHGRLLRRLSDPQPPPETPGRGIADRLFVPVFTEYLRNKTREEALELADITFTALSIILVGVSLLGVLFSPSSSR